MAFTSIFLAFSRKNTYQYEPPQAYRVDSLACDDLKAPTSGVPRRLEVVMGHCSGQPSKTVHSALLSLLCTPDARKLYWSLSMTPAIPMVSIVLQRPLLSTHCLSLPYIQWASWMQMCTSPFIFHRLHSPCICLPSPWLDFTLSSPPQ